MDRYQTANRQLGYRQINRKTTSKFDIILKDIILYRQLLNLENSDRYQTAMIQTDKQIENL